MSDDRDWAVQETDRLLRITTEMNDGNARVVIASRLRALREDWIAVGIDRVSQAIGELAKARAQGA